MNNKSIVKPMSHISQMMVLLETWVQRDWLREIDLALTRFLLNETQEAAPELMLAIALTSHQLGRGHVCLDLQETLNDPYMALSLPPDQYDHNQQDPVIQPSDLLVNMELSDWSNKIQNSDLVSYSHGNSPLVFDGTRLYLRRYWQYERNVEAAIEDRFRLSESLRTSLSAQLQSTLADLFPPHNTPKTDWQKVACALAAQSAFSIMTGGPGTGKTTTVVKLLALLQSIAIKQHNANPLVIRLAAPTGKAAARLKESISNAINGLPEALLNQAGLREAIPTEVITIHRLLGSRPDSRIFRYDARNPLALDVLVIDEASMVDLEMMSALLSALPEQARLILLGDKDQLASVEAGSVLGQLCRRAKDSHFTEATVSWIKTVTGENIAPHLIDVHGSNLDQHIVMLRESHRFNSASGIGQLASAINSGDRSQLDAIWQSDYSDLSKHDLMTIDDPSFVELVIGHLVNGNPTHSVKGYAYYLSIINNEKPDLNAAKEHFDQWAQKVLASYSQFQILCALRKGPFGIEGLNQRVADILKKQGLINPASIWYEGRPVLVTRNDYRLGLMNGDIGITLSYPQWDKQSGKLAWVIRVAFPKGDGSNGIYWILPSRLLSVETVFALTVHKSQGSEFEHCALIIPPKRNPILTRELIYTGITRAKKRFSLINLGDSEIIKDASTRSVLRSGGLFLDNLNNRNV